MRNLINLVTTSGLEEWQKRFDINADADSEALQRALAMAMQDLDDGQIARIADDPVASRALRRR